MNRIQALSEFIHTLDPMLKVGAVRYDEKAKRLRIVMRASPTEVETLSITRADLAEVDTIPPDVREVVVLGLEIFAQHETTTWVPVKADVTKSAQHWAFADACLHVA